MEIYQKQRNFNEFYIDQIDKLREISTQEKYNLIETISITIKENIDRKIKQIKDRFIKLTIEERTKVLFNKQREYNKLNNETVYRKFSCSGCNHKHIIGNRYKCTVCSYLNLCQM